jgi:uncharacterized YigZ family protein
MKTIAREAEYAFEVKRSRFIGRTFKCSTPDEALAAVRRVREAWKDASHHCWAYRTGTTGEQARYDNSGEPHGTAGPPILDVLKHNDLTNTLVVVTRYYGGTKLGAGGLVRAYGEAAKKAVEASGATELRLVKEFRVSFPYALLSSLEGYLAREGFEVAAKDFGESVTLDIRIPVDREPDFRAIWGHNANFRFHEILLGKGSHK